MDSASSAEAEGPTAQSTDGLLGRFSEDKWKSSSQCQSSSLALVSNEQGLSLYPWMYPAHHRTTRSSYTRQDDTTPRFGNSSQRCQKRNPKPHFLLCRGEPEKGTFGLDILGTQETPACPLCSPHAYVPESSRHNSNELNG